MNPNYDKLVRKLDELFMLDQADLDFGIYRIMNFRRDEIRQFIHRDLLTQVRAELDLSGGVDRQAAQRKLDAAIKQAQELDVDPETSSKVKDLRAELAQAGNAEALENEVFSQLYSFFSRYYDSGDFVSLRRYKRDVYAIPYEGEEVKLHWANADQYYIKSSEYFKKYRFNLPGGKAVEFTLREANTEQNNNKSTGNTERRFRLVDEDPVQVDGNTLRIYFNYLPVEKSLKRETLNKEAHERLTPLIPAEFVGALAPPPGKNSFRTLLEKHLNDYTARNSFDYFIHKDLGGFLGRELDFFIKNELLDIDEIDTQADAQQHMASQFAKIVALKKIARKIIAFLASLEDFQRSLWLKKKFVTEAQYCLTLDRIDPKFYPEIAANERQADEWVALFKIDQIGQDAADGFFQKAPYVRPMTVKFLEENPQLVLDTEHFDADFIMRLLATLPNLDEQTDGLLLHSDNFQALAFLQERYREQVKCVYIDPPYNTGEGDFPYKDNFQHSSWMSMMGDRILAVNYLLSEKGMVSIQIGDDENANLRILIDELPLFRKNSVVVRRGIKNVQAQFNDIDRLSQGHDIIHVLTKTNTRIPHLHQSLEEEKQGKWDTFWRGTDRETMRYPLFGKEPSTGQWRWEKNRTAKAVENYTYFVENESDIKSLDEWYIENLQSGSDLDFVRLNEENVVQYYVPPQSSRLVSDNWLDIPVAGRFTEFPHEKSIELLHRVINWNCSRDDIALDYFAGSGTTAHAVINLNREDGGKRKYILVEQGEYFDTVLLPRIKKVVYSKDWKNGSPQSRDTGVSHCLKYLRLESYEDTLNNLTLERSEAQTLALHHSPGFRESYLLQYGLAAEARASLAGTDAFANPFGKRLRLLRQNEEREATLDVVETFNYLLGLVVESTYEADGFRVVIGKLLPDAAGREPSILIVWRNCHEKTAEDLNAFFERQKFSPRDREFDRIYVNGDHTLQNVLDASHAPKVVLVEGEFRRRMFGE